MAAVAAARRPQPASRNRGRRARAARWLEQRGGGRPGQRREVLEERPVRLLGLRQQLGGLEEVTDYCRGSTCLFVGLGMI